MLKMGLLKNKKQMWWTRNRIKSNMKMQIRNFWPMRYFCTKAINIFRLPSTICKNNLTKYKIQLCLILAQNKCKYEILFLIILILDKIAKNKFKHKIMILSKPRDRQKLKKLEINKTEYNLIIITFVYNSIYI